MEYSLKMIFNKDNASRLEVIVFDRLYEIRRNEPEVIYDTRYANKKAQNVPNYIYSDSIQNLIRKIWRN